MRQTSAAAKWIYVGLSFIWACDVPAQNPERQSLCILLDTSGEMGFVVPRVRKEVRFLNAELKKTGRGAIAFAEMEGAAIDQPGGFSLPPRKNALIRLKTIFEKEQIDGVYWITHFKGLQSGNGFYLLNDLLMATRPDGKPNRQLVIRHNWPEQILAGWNWRENLGKVDEDPLHPKAFPGEWLEPVDNSNGYVLRSFRKLPVEYIHLTAYPVNGQWNVDLKNRYGIHFLRKGDYTRPFDPTGLNLLSKSTVVPYVSPDSRKARDQLIYREMCRRSSIEEDLSNIDADRIGVCYYLGYKKKDFNLAVSRPDKSNDPRIDYIRNVKAFSKEIRLHREQYESTPGRIYDTYFHEAQSANLSREIDHNEVFARRATKLIQSNQLDAVYLFTNGYTDARGYGKFTMELEPLAAFLKESGKKLYVRVPFELGIAPIELKRLAISTGGAVFFGTPDDPDFVFGRLKGKP